jgi:hypothetical protein
LNNSQLQGGEAMQCGNRKMMNVRRILILVAGITLLSILLNANALFAQQASQSTTEERQLASPNPNPPPPTNETRQLLDQKSQDEIAKLRAEIDTIKNILFYGGGFLAVIVGLLTLQSSALAWLSDRRTAASHTLAIKGEEASQSRAETIHEKFFEESHKTIGLVNATLRLARTQPKAPQRCSKNEPPPI